MIMRLSKHCIFGCDPLVTYNIPMHRFPHPVRHPDLLSAWVSIVGDYLKETDPMKIYRNKRICDCHFDTMDKISSRFLKEETLPSLNLHRVQQSISTFVEADHCYYKYLRESYERVMTTMGEIQILPEPSSIAADSTTNLPFSFVDITCVQNETSPIKTEPDTENPFDVFQNEDTNDMAIKIEQKQDEIRRLQLKVKSFKVRLREQKRISARLLRSVRSLTKSKQSLRVFLACPISNKKI